MRKTVAVLALMVACAACGASSTAMAQTAAGADYLPLAPGARWELRSGSARNPMVLEVVDRQGSAYVVQWINPFITAIFRFEQRGGEVHMTGLDTGQGMAPIPESTVYWDFGRNRGSRWNSPVGTQTVASRGESVSTPSGTYRDTIEIETKDKDGKSMFWTFARGVGLVRWGRGRDAYLLTSYRPGGAAAPPRAVERPAAPPPRASVSAGGGPLFIGVDANPNDKHGGGKNGQLKAWADAYDAGMSIVHIAPKWDGFEKSAGKFDFDDATDAAGEFAGSHNLPIALNVRVIDTNQRSMPKAYEKWGFAEQRTADRLRAALRAFPDVYKRQTRVLAIGNEVDKYFGSHRGEIADYATLLRNVIDTARQEFPNAQLTVNFTFDGAPQMDQFRAITDLVDIASFTYYPLNADFTMKDPSVARGDIEQMIGAARGKRVYFQEIGYASADRLKSSPDKQAQFYENTFAALREHRAQVVGATFLFMSDLSRLVVEYLGVYYRAANSANFKAYLQTLGLTERNGTAKPAWDVFRREAQAIKQGRQ